VRGERGKEGGGGRAGRRRCVWGEEGLRALRFRMQLLLARPGGGVHCPAVLQQSPNVIVCSSEAPHLRRCLRASTGGRHLKYRSEGDEGAGGLKEEGEDERKQAQSHQQSRRKAVWVAAPTGTGNRTTLATAASWCVGGDGRDIRAGGWGRGVAGRCLKKLGASAAYACKSCLNLAITTSGCHCPPWPSQSGPSPTTCRPRTRSGGWVGGG
jgi:hypothetical protein